MVYLNHRRFLSLQDPLRRARAHFPSRETPLEPPVLKTMEYIDGAIKKYESATTRHDKKREALKSGCKGSYALRKLPFHDRMLSTPVDPMHLIKNVVEHLVRLIGGAEDSRKVRTEEKRRGRFPGSWTGDVKAELPPAPFRLTAAEQKIANQRSQSIQVPAGFDWRPKAMFTVKAVGMKSHAWKLMVSTSILKYCLRGLLGKRQRQSLFFFCDVLSRLCAEVVDISLVNLLEDDVHRSLSLLERDFPVSLHVCVFHLLHHLPYYIRQYGPIYGYWMYPYERFNSWIIRRVQSRRFPESTVVETYRLHEWAHYLSLAGQLPDNALVHPTEDTDRHEDADRHVQVRHTVLSSDELNHLEQYYKEAIPQYGSLCARYESEKKKAKTRHHLKQFPPLSSWEPVCGPPLTPREKFMCTDLSVSVAEMHHFTYRDEHGRAVRLSTIKADTESSSSSYVFFRQASTVGRVSSFFEHMFVEERYTLAIVKWLGSPQRDPDSGIWYVCLNSVSCFS